MKTYNLCLVPCLNVTKEVVRTGGELELEIEAKEAVNVLHEVKERGDLVFNLDTIVSDL